VFGELSEPIRNQIIELVRELAAREPSDVWDKFYSAWKALAERNTEKAVSLLQDAAASSPDSGVRAASLRSLAIIQDENGNSEVAAELFRASLEYQSNSMFALMNLAEHAVRQHDYTSAESLYHAAIDAISDEADVNLLQLVARDFADLLVKLGRRAEAVSILSELLLRYPETPHLKETLGRIERG
jgi:tetratricopeptide (TPR) repeat protein